MPGMGVGSGVQREGQGSTSDKGHLSRELSGGGREGSPRQREKHLQIP